MVVLDTDVLIYYLRGKNESYLKINAKISSDLKNRGQPIGVMDELIASICITHQETLYSGNIKHFERIDDLNIKDWNKT
jgi:predicted nucleic acid-binding protein